MVGPTGVGKTEISRRMAKLTNAPFVKVEATKFTEVGYVGRDVESIIRDLAEIAIKSEKEKQFSGVKGKAAKNARNRVLNILVGPSASDETKQKFSEKLDNGQLNDRVIEIELKDIKSAPPPIDLNNSGSIGVVNLSEMINKAMHSDKKTLKKVTVSEALQALEIEESETLLDEDTLIKQAINSVENEGIVFIDEIDKIVVRQNTSNGKEISREGVQRDLLPLIEGTTVTTKYGTIKTDHILFICSGAFHLSKPADLLPELQGRLPIRVELSPLSEQDLLRILKEPEASLPIQYRALLATENVSLVFPENGLKKIAKVATQINKKVENIGARRLQTIMEKILEDISFNAPEMKGCDVIINEKFIEQSLDKADLNNIEDLSRFIL